MLSFLRSPLVRLAFGLAMLTVAILMVTDLLGFVPDTRKAELNSRKVIAESLAVQLSTGALDEQLAGSTEILRSVVERNDSVLSAALRRLRDDHTVEVGDHLAHWTLEPTDRSTPTQVQVPLYEGREKWGTVELRFRELSKGGRLFSFDGSFGTVVLFMALSGFLAYLFFLKRALRELNPEAVIPERVRNALDTLAEGLLIVDQKGYIVFSNQSFARRTGLKPEELVGKSSGDLDWEYDSAEHPEDLPWLHVLDGRALPVDVTVRLRTSFDEVYKFAVNATPITGSGDSVRGALITFDDVTEIEAKNEHLRRTLGKLEESQREITRQNQELQVLATRDPLTGSLNRRAFFQGFESLFADAQDSGEALSCIMVDIDHFKSVNDTYGHGVGDIVIKFLAAVLADTSRPTDLVGRFGGEEFCVVLPGAEQDVAAEIAERMRLRVMEGDGNEFGVGLSIKSSFGVSTIRNGAKDHAALVEQADEALYVAKETGRNQVVKWAADMKEKAVAAEAERQAETGEDAAEAAEAAPAAPEAPAESQPPAAKPEPLPDLSHFAEEEAAPVAVPEPVPEPAPAPAKAKPGANPSSRLVLFDRIDQAIGRGRRYGTQLAVMVIDIDVMKRVKETLGGAAGDKFAKQVMTRLKEILRDTDTVALPDAEPEFTVSRLGGDELVILLTDLEHDEVTTAVIQRIFVLQNQPITVEGSEFFPNPKIGVSMFPNDGDNPDELLSRAASAMREAKESPGRNSFRFYAEDINQRSKKRIRLEAELHRALERDEFLVYYQPKINLLTGSVQSMEALLRWKHPEMGLVPPNDFIPLAEQTGLIEEISLSVIRTVCSQVRFWRQAGHTETVVAVNLSAVEFRKPELAREIIGIVEQTGIPFEGLELEVTESLVMHNVDAAIRILEEMSAAGLSISMDDFGTGYSSLSYLKRFPISKLKIDRAFIMDITEGPEGAALVSAIIAMSHSLGLKVVAEGVETEEQLRFLQDLRCEEAQGYLISRPLPREEMSALLADPEEVKQMVTEYVSGPVEDGGPMQLGTFGGMMGILNEAPDSSGGKK